MGRHKGKLSKGQPAGARSKSGRLRARTPLRVAACDGVVRRRAMYGTGEDDRETFDAIGRAHSAGLLHADATRAKAMLDAARRLAARYWHTFGFPTPDSLARYQPVTGAAGASDSAADQRREEAMNAALAGILALGRPTRRAFDQLVIDINPDSGPPWLDRIIFAHRSKRTASEGDYALMQHARDGLETIC